MIFHHSYSRNTINTHLCDPLRKVLQSKGVNIRFNVLVKDLDIQSNTDGKVVEALITEQDGKEVKIPIGKDDFVIVTTGSMTEDTFYGDNKMHRSSVSTIAAAVKVQAGNSGKIWLPNPPSLVNPKSSAVTSKNQHGSLRP
ncbi:Oleate hydratase [Sphingobacterium multivorum]|uniref:Oleate hydratase n=1 Tax=Sphingobacterium multivorum TaxID=28454 RepID=A0A2X2JJT7_SPHMU|nr:Oleate hydratase [Sphingobacterium multivorum]